MLQVRDAATWRFPSGETFAECVADDTITQPTDERHRIVPVHSIPLGWDELTCTYGIHPTQARESLYRRRIIWDTDMADIFAPDAGSRASLASTRLFYPSFETGTFVRHTAQYSRKIAPRIDRATHGILYTTDHYEVLTGIHEGWEVVKFSPPDDMRVGTVERHIPDQTATHTIERMV